MDHDETAAEKYARRLRVREGATKGIRAVPPNPSPESFPSVPFACDMRPQWCGECRIACGFTDALGRRGHG